MNDEEPVVGAKTTRLAPFVSVATMCLLGAICLLNLFTDRGSLQSAPYFNDLTMHEQMVRFASQSLLHFHWPATQWYPYLNLGSPQFLHYQGLGATIAGFFGIFLTPSLVFRFSLYLLVALWPIAIYSSARIFGVSKPAAIASALVASLLSSVPHIGYEARAYEWIGYGVWAQLCASWTLPFAWAWSWRAIKDVRHAWKAVLFIAITAGLHFETGYSAFGALLIFPFIIPSQLKARIRHALFVLGCSLFASLWVIVPLLVFSKWAALNVGQENSVFGRGYGAGQNFQWLIQGQYFDAGRFPIITIAVALGIVAAIFRWKREPFARAFVVLGVLFFLLSFGPNTWGSLVNIIPGHADIFFRRFIIPVDLAALFFVGVGVSWFGDVLAKFATKLFKKTAEKRLRVFNLKTLGAVMALLVAILVTVIALPNEYRFQTIDNHSVTLQNQDDLPNLQYITPIISYLKSADNGRVYCGLPSNWGQQFKFGIGPMYLYLADNDVDQISTQGWAASLMEEPQTMFNQSNLSDYEMYGVRYLLLPKGMKSPIAANLILSSGPYQLYEIPQVNYFSIVEASGSIDENKADISEQSGLAMNTEYFQNHQDFLVNYGSAKIAIKLPGKAPTAPLGSIVSENIQLANGEASGVFDLKQSANVMLSASFDPGWQAFVDGVQVPTQMLAPALVSVQVPAGEHTVVFRYQGFRWYLPLFILAALALALAVMVGRRRGHDDNETSPTAEEEINDSFESGESIEDNVPAS